MSNHAEHQQYYIGVKAVIVHDDQLMVMQRKDHGSWDLPGGRIAIGETPETALQREVPEEIPGARVLGIQGLLHAEQPDFTLPDGNRLMLLFYAVNVEMPTHVIMSDEHMGVNYVSNTAYEELAHHSPIILAAKRALQNNHFLD